jgi:hypothetical protein
VQGADNDWDQPVADGSVTIAFTVPAANLLAEFGPGEYRMRIFDNPDVAPMAEGVFVLLADPAAASAAPSATP